MNDNKNAQGTQNSKGHQDFGEKIGGARKDLWKERGLYMEDLDAMNDREAEKYVKKDNIWKKPDYQAMHDGGIPIGVVYFMKKARDAMNASPQYYRSDDTPEKRLARQKEYIMTVRQLQDVLMDVRTVEDALQACDKFMVGNGYLERRYSYGGRPAYNATAKGQENPAITNKLLKALLVRNAVEFEYNFAKQAEKDQFLVPKEKKTPAGYSIGYFDGSGLYAGRDGWKAGTYYVLKGHYPVQHGFATEEDALAWAKAQAKQRSKGGKVRFTPPQLADVRRTGPDYRNGADITGEDYLEAFGFRGGEFGNWMNQNDRQVSLNMGYEALKDLASVLMVGDKDIALDGTLAIAFGARGSGNAAAHYEPLRKVINLTKMHGAGSLAHEWWHALDDHLGTRMGTDGMLSEKPCAYEPMKKLVDTMKYKAETPEQAAARTEGRVGKIRKNAESWLDFATGSLKRTEDMGLLEAYMALREDFLSGGPGSVDRLNALKKAATGRMIPKKDRERLELFEHILGSLKEDAPQAGRTETDYYKNSVRMGKECEKDGGYWDSNMEMTARAFACYVKDRLPYVSDYLVGHADCAVTFVVGKDGEMAVLKAFPEGDEREAIDAAFDSLFDALKADGMFAGMDAMVAEALGEDVPV